MKIVKKSIYEFDTTPEGILVFTDKNIEFVSAIVKNDSAYRQSFDPECQHSSAGLLKGRFPESDEALLEAVVLIDKENSTHLAVTGKSKGSSGGRKIAAQYIAEHYEYVRAEIEAGRPEVVEKLAKELVPGRYNISFASKFCTFTQRYCFGKDDFSIVDTVLCQVLPAYEILYLHREARQGKWSQQHFDYKAYQDTIKAILDSVNGSGDVSHKVTRQEFDLLLWYYYKGSDDRIKHLYQAIKQSIG